MTSTASTDTDSDGRVSCPECGESVTAREGEEVVCDGCGHVLDGRRITDNPVRASAARNGDYDARAGTPLTYMRHDMGMSTEIGDSRELRKVPSRKRGQYARMRKWHSRLTGSKDRNLGVAYAELRRLSSQLNLPDTVAEEVARLYEKAVDHDLVRGRSIEGVLAALVYAVARKQGTPRTLEEIEEASGIEARDIGRTYRYVARELDLWIPPARPEDYLPRFADELDLSGAVVARARDLVEHARDADLLVGKGRTGIAAAVLYTASVLEGEKRTQQEVADAVGVTVETLRNRYQELMQDVVSVTDG